MNYIIGLLIFIAIWLIGYTIKDSKETIKMYNKTKRL